MLGSAPKAINIDAYTAAVSPLILKFRSTVLSTATCFFWERRGSRFLVTNWHNFSGKDSNTGLHLSPTASEPNEAVFLRYENKDLNSRRETRLLIEDQDGPTWIEHSMGGRKVDIVCHKLDNNVANEVFPINTLDSAPLRSSICDDVFIIGFPLGQSAMGFPLWKRASVASEPEIDFNGLPCMLVDTATAKGMSGSPVVRRSSSGQMEDGNFAIMTGPGTRVIGVYSGRFTTGDNLEAQLGLVWRVGLIDEIIDANQRGRR